MVHLSRFELKENQLKKIFDLFFKVVGNRDDKEEFENVIADLLSQPERIMIAKRLAIIYLLQKNIEVINICMALKVSKATVYTLLNRNCNFKLKLFENYRSVVFAVHYRIGEYF